MKVFVLIERRADYSRYKPILERMKADSFFEIYLVVTGICLLDLHGKDVNYIEDDGFTIDAKIPMFDSNSPDSGAEMVRSMARVLTGVTYELEKSKPDLVLSGFDIGGNFAVTVAAAHMNIPVAHIQGGEVTGSIDESIRHAMTKFSHIHFPATEDAEKRLIRLGENPKDIHVVGCPSIDVLVNTPTMNASELEKEFDLDFSKPFVLVIQHPVTTEAMSSIDQIRETLKALRNIDAQVVFLLPNNDAGHAKIIEEIKASGFKWIPSLPTLKFVNLYRNAWALVGNSSSGIHETPTLKIPAINIGNRQMGRERASNVLDVPNDAAQIEKAIQKALFDDKFRKEVSEIKNPYGEGNSAKQIVDILKNIDLSSVSIQKIFYEGK
ncbi:UDP-N-acetylglucosamine 2-epimerase [Algoriphagus yeomjeoni]|uniref:UDP-N-acetylglucosamine 2-epimerase (Non-hydrolysing)/GDP/UDP-N,N'-diacetylbacillosamine 2-epimerase (Hydrolysing) n=1 Tax=Algoriphagus yeomjeoni TaxID=291403 RepID=A0A327P0T6_9BACT|nr:UDP-N-acetylglucosamine 2-epimerase [Algoriphagus yeomjeoni]RAI83546.1 UDP-N-acetylglucosamine 2-epimerase (non-hydrolysing)/GDP/UDP-N,N'-diacetylbacillosamine 2-epimerase (hydrolysing) [Algoriphagus yeomjeoni]